MKPNKYFNLTNYSTFLKGSSPRKKVKPHIHCVPSTKNILRPSGIRLNNNTFYSNVPQIHFNQDHSNHLIKLDDDYFDNLSDIYNSSNYIAIPQKYNISSHLTTSEKDEIKKVFSSKKNNNVISSITNPPGIYGIYSNPFKTKEHLKAKQDIHKQFINIRIQHQMDKFNSMINGIGKYKKSLSKMSKVKVSKIVQNVERDGMRRMESFISNNKEEDKVDSTEPTKTFNIMTREQLLNEIRITFGEIHTQLHPSARMQFSFVITEDDYLYIFGGILSRKLDDIWRFHINSKDHTLKWEKVKPKDNITPLPRYGHSMTFFDNQIFIYGGSLDDSIVFKNKEDSIAVYNIKNKQFSFPICQQSQNVPFRRNHIGLGIGPTMFIHGGIEEETGAILNDLWLLDCVKYKWSPLLFKSKIKIPYLAFHCCCLVIKHSSYLYHHLFNIYRFPDTPATKKKVNQKIFEGVYIFGGIEKNGNYSNKLWCIKVGVKPVEVISPKTSGIPPCGRINFGMTFINELDFLIIHGGKNNDLSCRILNDVHILNLETFNWIRPVYKNEDFLAFAEHVIFSYANTIYILGGMNNEGFAKFEFYTIDFEYFKQKKNAYKNLFLLKKE